MRFTALFIGLFLGQLLQAQFRAQEVPSSVILKELKALQPREIPRVLYVAAHPDDENTRLIAALANNNQFEVAYLSLTRGDGGQNLIGPELSEALGIIRTQELLEARRIDGGRQFFTRAVDFGYSKNPEETFQKWNRDSILQDVVRIIRTYQPSAIVTRFPPDARAGHGHHTASAMLAEQAFDLAADPSFRPELGSAYAPVAVYWNASVWWDDKLPEKADTSDAYTKIEVGEYSSLLGRSFNELASASRSMHKSQGFGIPIQRGTNTEYLVLRKGKPFFNVPRIETRELRPYEAMLGEIIAAFDPEHPEKSVKALFALRKEARSDTRYANRIARIETCIAWCMGLYGTAITPVFAASPGEGVDIVLEILVRNPVEVQLREILCHGQRQKINEALPTNQQKTFPLTVEASSTPSNPYWLEGNYTTRYVVPSLDYIGKAENDPALAVDAVVLVDGEQLLVSFPVVYRWTDRVKGELQRQFVVAPKATVTPAVHSLVFPDRSPKSVSALVKNFGEEFNGNLVVDAPEGWEVEPAFIPVDLTMRLEEVQVKFTLTPTKMATAGTVHFHWDQSADPVRSYQEIAYDHIQTQVMFLPAHIEVCPISADLSKGTIGYIPGAGDEIPVALEQLGYTVEVLNESKLADEKLSKYQTIITGIRAYNTNPWLPTYQSKLMDYVRAGGNLVVQYNTNGRDLQLEEFGPYPFKLGRDRVTEEDAPAGILIPDHPLLNEPLKITTEDFNGWVQERGLYFASEWDSEYEPLISWHDGNEAPKLGGLITCAYGKGHFTYTGISFFRQLPAGVPGAYKLLINLVEYED